MITDKTLPALCHPRVILRHCRSHCLSPIPSSHFVIIIIITMLIVAVTCAMIIIATINHGIVFSVNRPLRGRLCAGLTSTHLRAAFVSVMDPFRDPPLRRLVHIL